jgi:hypothetical protein
VNDRSISTLTLQLNECGQLVIHFSSTIGNLPSAFCNPANEATLVRIPTSNSSCADVPVAISILRPEDHHGSSVSSSAPSNIGSTNVEPSPSSTLVELIEY